MQDPIELALNIGFSHAGAIDPAKLRALPEVRDMCADGRCRRYKRSWSCPPACGTLEEAEARMHRYRCGVLVQTTAELEDDFDVDAMMEAEKRHKTNFFALAEQFRVQVPDCLPLGAGSCTVCETCTYPDRPCRFPEKMFFSMEACGILVSEACTLAGLKYYYGARTLTYSSCVLYNLNNEQLLPNPER